ncbi:MAG: glycosyltransferase [Candidatus Pacebacteria bacterium]|nr:glycosyltransferase [Candidatus Paceibacterota bacterium]
MKNEHDIELQPPPTHHHRKGRRQRIAMVSTHGYVAADPPLGAPDTGGQVVYVLELSRKLAELGYEVDIYTRQFEEQSAIEPVEEHVRIVRLPCGGNAFIPKEFLCESLHEWAENALRFIRKEDLDYQFINSHYWDGGVAGQELADTLEVPHVHTPHSLGVWKKRNMQEDAPEEERHFDEKYNFTSRIHHEKLLYRESYLVIATSPIQLDILRRDYDLGRDDVRMIPPGYDDSRFFPVGEATRQATREDYGYDGKVVACVGRLARNKGFDLLIHAFSVVAERIPQARLQMAVGAESSDPGDSEMLEELFTLVRDYELEDRVTITESLPDEEMADFYRAADVFALPSRYEPFGMTAIEAMACGTPAVITVNGGLYRAVTYGRDALYADSFDKYDFGITLMKVLKYGRLRQDLGREGARRVRSLFTWTGIAQQLLRAVEGRSGPTLKIAEFDEEKFEL